MWYVIDSEPGAGLYVGFNKDVCRKEVEERVKNNTILDILNFYPTKAGDAFFIPAGTVHAIGAGNLICEIQQSSNCTYRIYDYNRKDKFGMQRELHLKKALDVLNYEKYTQINHEKEEGTGKILGRCKYFESVLYEIKDKTNIILDNDRFCSFICINGSGKLHISDCTMDIAAGESIFIPAQKNNLFIEGNLTALLSRI